MKKKEKTNSQFSFYKKKLLDIIKKLKKLDTYFLLIPLLVVLIYNLIFFNRFYPITEGWFSTYAWMFNHGQVPYRDFYLFLTPLYIIIMSIFTAIFGYSILYLRIFGIAIMLLMTFFLYKNLQLIFGSAIAAFSCIVGIIYYQSNNAHITYDFIQFLSLFGLIQSYFIVKYAQGTEIETKKQIKLLVLAGIFASFAFLTKQSNGTMITAFSFLGLVFVSVTRGKKEFLLATLSYIVGFAIPVLIILLWLLANAALIPFFNQILLDAVSAKGGTTQIFFSWFQGILTENFVARFKEIVFIVFYSGYWLYFFIDKKEYKKNIQLIFLLIVSLSMLLVVLLPLLIDKSSVATLASFGMKGINNIIVAAIAVLLLVILAGALSFILRKPFNMSLFFFSFVALGYIYGTGTSAGVTEVGAFIGFCIFIGLMLYYRSIFGIGKIFIVLFCISFTFMLVEAKYEQPYLWWNVTSPDIRTKLYTTDKIPMLEGMYTSQFNINLVEQVTAEIEKGSKPGDRILLFPNIPIFYLITDRRPPGKALVHWFDFLSDDLAIKEAQVIRKNPPKVIVYLDLGTSVWEAHERLFRNGKPSGQRQVNKVIMADIKSQKMHVTKKFELAKGVTLTVWRR
ncbi:MAG TPA: glycosyltransferase family 39 protein [Candidatus Sulfotelmatobacter sp.]|jgi:hypothetical protein|nr:glycosyltransferase family 39 protein [Candidatus Sulfotelmatobacter sp.]